MAEKAPDPTPTPATPAKPADLDVSSLLEKDEAEVIPPVADAPENAEESAKVEDDAVALPEDDKKPEEAPAAPVVEEKAPAGTPDKALQKMQQDLAAATRQISDLQEKVDAGEKLTPAEKVKVETAQRKLEVIRTALAIKGKDIDLLDNNVSEAVAQTLIENDKAILDMQQELAATRADVAALRQTASAAQSDVQWADHAQAYPGVNVKDVYANCLKEAGELTGIDPAKADPGLLATLRTAASNLFHQRAGVAAKSVAAVAGKKAAEEPPKKTTRTAPPVTPGGARVQTSSGVVKTGQPSDDSAYMQAAAALVTDD